MANRPGGEMAKRPLHFIWICDKSGSMSLDGKVQALNNAIRESLPSMQQVAEDNPSADVLIRTLEFSHGAEWRQSQATRVRDFRWADLVADTMPQQNANMDVVFLVDTSGSMGDEIEAVKNSCVTFADQIIREGAGVRMGLVGFDIGGHRGVGESSYTVHNLSAYTIGIWPLTSPDRFKANIQSLTVGLFGGAGCYLANPNTVDIFPHIVRTFDGPQENARVLVIISDEMGTPMGVPSIVHALKSANIKTHVLGVHGTLGLGAHELIAKGTGGQFWNIHASKGVQDFGELLQTVAQTIAREMSAQLQDGTVSAGTDMGAALRAVAEHLKIPPMTDRALPPVLVLISDGQPTDDFEIGLQALISQPWGKKAVRIAIAIGQDADHAVLQKFIGHSELKPLQANNAEQLVRFIRWVSTAVLKSASAPASRTTDSLPPGVNIPLPVAPEAGPSSSSDPW